jgi:hypothetical protein
MQREVILLAELYFDGGFVPLYFSSQQWYSKSTDSIGVREYDGRIVGDPTFSVRVGNVIWGDSPTTGFGALELANTDNTAAIDNIIFANARDNACILRMVNKGDGYDDSVVVARCIMDSVEKLQETIKINLRGMDSKLDRPLQPVLYDDSVPNAELQGTPLPITIGSVYLAEPARYDQTNLEFHLNDSNVEQIDFVYSGGSIADDPSNSPPQWDYNAQRTGFEMSTSPSARVTADLVGPNTAYTDLLSGNGKFYDPAQWPGATPTGWTSTGSGTVSEMDGIGAEFEWGSSQVASIQTTANVLPDTNAGWYMVCGKIGQINGNAAAHLGIRFRDTGTLYRVFTPGEFCVPIYVAAGANRTIRLGGTASDNTAGSLSLHAFYAYKMDNGAIGDWLYNSLWHLLARGGITEESIDFSELVPTALTWMREPRVGFYDRSGTTARQAINALMASVSGWTYVGPDGLVRMGTVYEPTSDPDLKVSRLNLIDYPIYQPDLAPGISDTYGAGKNWSPYSEDELAGITHPNRPPFMADYKYKRKGDNRLHRFYRHGVGAPAIGTLLYNSSDAQSEADRITDLYGSRRGFWTFSVAMDSPQDAATLYPGAVVELDDTLFAGSAIKALLVAVHGQYRNNVLTLTVWR